MTTVAVTGATGFIGRHVLAELARHPVDVVALGRPASAGALGADRVHFVPLDIHEAQSRTFAESGRPDALIHLAWGGLPNYRSLHHIEQELPAQYRFLSELVQAGLPTLVVAGTCFEYGMQSGALDESMDARPANPYGFAKNTLRQQLDFLRAVHPFRMSWARLFYLHGAGQAASSLVPQLERAVARGDKVFPMSGGEQLRDYLPVEEIARSLVALALGGADAGVVNVCSGEPVSVRRFVERVLAERGFDIALDLGVYPYPDYEPFAFWGRRDRLDAALKTVGAETFHEHR
jgi:nucleoside-diphosphate-sugar epimerase